MSSEPDSKKARMAEETQPVLSAQQLDRFSRQNAALGAETTAKLIKMRVLVYGLRGVGIETCKNLALQGAGAITLIDSETAQMKDTGCNFFIFEEDVVQKNLRANACAPRLQELNPICDVSVAPSLTDELITSHSAVVITQFLPLAELIRIDKLCVDNDISFFYSLIHGVSSNMFVNHGPNHIIHDPDGEKPLQKMIVEITPLEGDECLIRYDTPEGELPVAIDEGDFEVTEVEGCDGINGLVFPTSHPWKDPVKTVRVPFNISSLPKYVIGGLLTQKKLPKRHAMQSMSELVVDPGMLTMTDLLGFTEMQQHAAFVGLMTFAEQQGHLPRLYNEVDATNVVGIIKKLVETKAMFPNGCELDEDLIKKIAKLASVEIQPIAAFVGGVLAQEVVKVTGKFTPIPGFMHFSAAEALPDDVPTMEHASPRGHRTDELAAVYGWPFVEKVSNLNYFMVGCGALGCEFMKNFALNGIFCGPEGKLIVTDADRIELSNLSRQFLFREHNVGQPKSKAAGEMATVMNSEFKIESMEHFVGSKSEDIFHDDFWASLDGVCNALDNMEARLYVDKACVKYEKPLLESGTMGTSGNVDTIAPFKTRTYAEGGAAVEGGGVPMCTLRNFPHLTDHCIEWARDQFALLFVKMSKSAEGYVANPEQFERKVRDTAGSEPGVAFFDTRCVTSLLRASRAPTMGSAAQLAFDMFHYMFRDRILDLQSAFPKDARMTNEDGVDIGPFWSEKKRYPTVVVYNPEDETHTNFMLSATCMFAVMLGLIPPKEENDSEWLSSYRERDWIVNMTSDLVPPEYVQAPVSGAGISGPEDIDAKMDHIIDALFEDLRQVANGITLPKMEPADFEKDDDLNFHIAFITSCANLRCDNYSIKRTDFQACKVVAGKIIAAIATTTAAVCGLVILELFKVTMGLDSERLMNRQIGLGVNAFTSFTQEPPKKYETFTETTVPPASEVPADAFDEAGKIKEEYITSEVKRAYPEGHTIWDKIEVDGNMSLSEFSKWLESEHKLKMNNWNFIYGTKQVESEGKMESSPVTTPVYPLKPVLDYSLIPALDLTKAQATQALMRNPKAKPLQQYIAIWAESAKTGVVPETPTDTSDVITSDTSLKSILYMMAKKADSGMEDKSIDNRTIPALEGRKFWVIPGNEGPDCSHAETYEDVYHLVSFKVII